MGCHHMTEFSIISPRSVTPDNQVYFKVMDYMLDARLDKQSIEFFQCYFYILHHWCGVK